MNLDKYIGIPFRPHGRTFDGCDCWGLVRLVYQHEKDIILPDYSNQYEKCQGDKNVPFLISRESESWEEIENPKPLDLILILSGGRPEHIAMVASKKKMLHTTSSVDSCLEDFNSFRWRPNIVGFYRRK